MEYVQGMPLSKLVEKHRKFFAEEIVYVAESVAKALKSAWNSPAQIVHRDIKPANIMVSYTSSIISPSQQADKSASLLMADIDLKSTQIKVMDFGLAKLVQKDDHEATLVGTVIGTPKYISPEQGMGNPADIRSDIYSLGIVLYEMATGKIPFEGESAMSMIRHHIYDTAIGISQQIAEFPAALEAIIMKCIQKDPNTRYANPTQLLEDLDALEKSKSLKHAKVDPSRVSTSAVEATMMAPSSIISVQAASPRKRIIIISAALSTLLLVSAFVFWSLQKKADTSKISNILQSIQTAQQAATAISPTVTSDTQPEIPAKDLTLAELEGLYEEAKKLFDQKDFDQCKSVLEVIIKKKSDYTPAVNLLEETKKGIEEREKIRLSTAMRAEELISMSNAQTAAQRRFNTIIGFLESKDYDRARKETEKLMELEDNIIPPSAIYLQMRLWSISQEESVIKEMDILLRHLKTSFPETDCIGLAEQLLEKTHLNREQQLVNTILTDVDKEENLLKRKQLLETFIQNNQVNVFIAKVKDKLERTLEEIKT
jgi:serine/threonine protein kinase